MFFTFPPVFHSRAAHNVPVVSDARRAAAAWEGERKRRASLLSGVRRRGITALPKDILVGRSLSPTALQRMVTTD